MLRRKAYDGLLDWKNDHEKECLLVKGQRQVGKTYIIDAFIRDHYRHCIRMDLGIETAKRAYFEGNLDVDSILRRMSFDYPQGDFVPGETVIFIDEIQDCPAARTSLKSFAIDGRYDVIASGSMLGVAMYGEDDDDEDEDDGDTLSPMGYVRHMTMRSLDFEEFLWAKGIRQDLIDEVRGRIKKKEAIDTAIMDGMKQAFTDFMLVGGMPRAVDVFLSTGSYAEAHRVLGMVRGEIARDINRYNKGEDRIRTLDCFESIPNQLAETNKRFKFSRIQNNRNCRGADRYEGNLHWIKDAGYGNFCYCLKEPTGYWNYYKDNFKVYMSDTGILMDMYGDNTMRSIFNNDDSEKKGAIAENIVAECIRKCGYRLRYFRKDKGEERMEIDFVVDFSDRICAVEVKSGKDRNAPSLGKIARFYDVRRVMLEEGNIRVDEDGVEHYPLFAAAFIDAMDPEPAGPVFKERDGFEDRRCLGSGHLLNRDPDILIAAVPLQLRGVPGKRRGSMLVAHQLPAEPGGDIPVGLVQHLRMVSARPPRHGL